MASYSKFGAQKTQVDGITFASKKEANRYSELLLLERAKAIGSLELQPRFDLTVKGVKVCTYVADFRYFDHEKQVLVVEDAKGFKTPEYRLKKKLLLACLGIEITEV